MSSNVRTFLKTDCSTHVKSWWDAASGLVSRGSEWLGTAASDVSKAAMSVEPSLLLGLGAAGVGLAAAYGAYRWYRSGTASSADEEVSF